MRGNHAEIWQRLAVLAPERTAVVAGERSLSYAEFDALASRAAGALAARGLRAGDPVGFYLHNTSEFLVGFFACLKLGAVPAPMNFRYRAPELVELVRTARPRVMLYPAGSRQTAAEAQRLLGEDGPLLWAEVDDGTDPEGPGAEGMIGFAELAEGPELPAVATPDPDTDLYIFTGGTTGRPKAVVWSIGGLMDVQGSSTYTPVGLDIPETMEEAVRVAADPSTPRVVTLPLAPFIHATALFMSTNTLNIGGTVVLTPTPSLNAAKAAELSIRQGVTQLVVAGDAVALPLAEALEEHPLRDRLSVRSVLSSGMRFSDEVKARLHRLAPLTVLDILGSSEGGPYAMAITRSEADLPARFRLVPGAVVLDDDSREVQDTPGATGVLAYRGPMPKGYLNDPERSQEAYPVIGGVRYVRPGDHVKVGEDHRIEFLGRGSAVINTGGEKVFPAEVEEALLDHPEVTDAVVFGLPDRRMGEKVCAVVAVQDVSAVAPSDLRHWVHDRLAGYKKPRTIVVRQSLDRTPAGKVNMRAVKEAARREAEESAAPHAA